MSFFTRLLRFLVGPPRQPPELAVLGLKGGSLSVQPEVVPKQLLSPLLSCIGQSGSGKSTLITNLLYQVAAWPSRPGAMVLDLKDDLCLDAATVLPSSRRDDVLLVNFADVAFPVGFNPLANIPAPRRTLATLEIVSALMRIFEETGTGPRMNHVFTMAIATLVEVEGASPLDLPRLLVEPDFRAWAIAQCSNEAIRGFWETEWRGIVGAKESSANVQSLLNKLGLLKFPELQHILGQSNRTINLRECMDTGKILLVSMPQGLLGEAAANLLAALFVACAQVAAQSRVELRHAQRRPFYIFADEFQNYDISSFDKLITEGRSMGISCVTSCQYEEQISPTLRKAIQKNATLQLLCQKRLDTQLHAHHRVRRTFLQEPDDNPNKLLELAALPPLPVRDPDQLAYICERSRRLLATPRAEVERDIARRLCSRPDEHRSFEPSQPVQVPQERRRRGHFFEADA